VTKFLFDVLLDLLLNIVAEANFIVRLISPSYEAVLYKNLFHGETRKLKNYISFC
jgi:hypothetical protein